MDVPFSAERSNAVSHTLTPHHQNSAFNMASTSTTHTQQFLESSLHLVSTHLLTEVKREKEEKDHISEDLLLALHFVHGPSIVHALDLVDRKAVCHVTSPSRGDLYQVKSANGIHHYICHVSPRYNCSCPFFQYGVMSREEALYCKHLLAVQLCDTLGLNKELHVSDEEFVELSKDHTNS